MILLSLASYIWRHSGLRRLTTLCLGLVALAATARGQAWTDQNIGAVGLPGQANEYMAGTIYLEASGADIWDRADGFRFRHRQWTGDGELIARIWDFDGGHAWTKIGVMFRESLSADSRHAFALISNVGVAAHYRAETGGDTFMPAGPTGPWLAPVWLRLTRTGNTFSTYWSADGTSWTLVGTMSVNLPSTVYAGIAFTSHDNSNLATATVEAVRVQALGSPFPAALPPAAPINLEARAIGSGTISLNWTDQADTEVSFEIQFTTNGVNWVNYNPTLRNQPGIGHTGLTAGTTYTYRVRARNGAGNSAFSNTASATTNAAPVAPNPPSNLTAAPASASRINLTWSDNSADETFFEIQRSTDGLMYGLLDYVQGTGPTYADTTVTAGTTYYYRVRASNADASSTFSNVASATPGTSTPPAAPTEFWSRLSTDGTRIELLWTDNANNETGFEIERATGAGGFVSLLNPPANGSLALDTSAQPGVQYSYRIRSVNTFGPSAWSSVITRTIPASPGPGGWTSTDVGPVSAAGSSSESGGIVTVRGSGNDIWDWADEFHFRHQTLTGDGTIVARVRQLDAVHSWSKAGVMFREALGPTSRNVYMFNAVNGTALQARAGTDTAITFGATPPGGAMSPRWLRLVRSGNTFTAAESVDGIAWTTVGSTQLALPATLYVGLAVTSHQDGTIAGAQFEQVTVTGGTTTPPPTPPPTNPPAATWQFGDIGNTGISGSNTSSGNTITIRAAGADIWDRADAFRFVYRALTGDGIVEAQVSSLTNTHGWAKAGVMIRASTDANAANVFAFATPTWQGLGAQVRPTAGAETTHQYGPARNAPTWLRLQRTGNTFTASSSLDGVTWTPFATHTVAMGATAYFGFAVTAHDATQLNTATFTDPFIQ